MSKLNINRSPLFYVGDKYKLMPQLVKIFPEKINTFHEPFVGGGSVFLNTKASKFNLNDVDRNIISIHKYLLKSSKKPKLFFSKVTNIISNYGLSRSYTEDVIPIELKLEFKKTYYAKFNSEQYKRMRSDLNSSNQNDPLILYLLLIYGFNRMLRFNSKGEFNLPVGNVDFNLNVVRSLEKYFSYVSNSDIAFSNLDFKDFITASSITKNDFVYFDPPYSITYSEYNKIWNVDKDTELFRLADELNSRGIRFALSNVTHYRGDTNKSLIKWSKGYNVYNIESNYISFNHNGKKDLREVLITNY